MLLLYLIITEVIHLSSLLNKMKKQTELFKFHEYSKSLFHIHCLKFKLICSMNKHYT